MGDFREAKDRIRIEESRMKELENYHKWQRKEENFHLQQQRQRSAIRLVEKRERPIDLLAKNILILGLTNEEMNSRVSLKYKEKYNAIHELNSLELELEEPHIFLKDLQLSELKELLNDVNEFRTLEREVSSDVNNNTKKVFFGDTNMILRYWEGLFTVIQDEIRQIEMNEVEKDHSNLKKIKSLSVIEEIRNLFQGKHIDDLIKMRNDILDKLDDDEELYWHTVLEQLMVHLAKADLSDIHMKILVCQLEKLEKRKNELGSSPLEIKNKKLNIKVEGRVKDENSKDRCTDRELDDTINSRKMNKYFDPNFGNLEEELGLSNEVNLGPERYTWNEKYRPRKPRYFNRVKTGYDWNKYNQTHYDHDCPPPKIVQGYKFNIFYPDLVNRTTTPSYRLGPADTREFCIIRFHAGPPYEDVAFKVINREWNRSRKRGFRSTFERGVLSVYFNFMSHWYRR